MCACPDDHVVAVLEKPARLAGRKRNRLAPAFGDFQEAAEAARCRTGDRAGAEQVAGVEVAAAAGVMRDQLRHGPIEVARVAVGQAMGREIPVAHALGEQQDLQPEVDVEYVIPTPITLALVK